MSVENQAVTYFDKYSIAKRYGVGINKALNIIRAIRDTCGGGSLPSGKVLPAEVEFWENKYHHMTPVSEQEEKVTSIQFDMSTAKYIAEEILTAFYLAEQNCVDKGTITGKDLSDRFDYVYAYYEKKYGVKVR